MEELLKRLRNRSQALNQATDDLNRYIEDVEERVRDIRTGVEVWLEVEVGEGWQIGWTRGPDRRWGFGAKRTGQRTPLLSAPRSVRVEAAPLLDEIVTVMAHRAEEMAQEVMEAVEPMEDNDG